MTKTNDLNWRLMEQPSSAAVVELVRTKIITEDEARSILFRTVDEKQKDDEIESLKRQIDFLKEILDNISKRQEITLTYAPSRPQYIYWRHHTKPAWLATAGAGGANQMYSINTAKLMN